LKSDQGLTIERLAPMTETGRPQPDAGRPGRLAWRLIAIVLVLASAGAVRVGRAAQGAPANLKLMSEASGYSLASNYDDVMKFVKAAAAAAPQLVHVTTMGTTVEGRSMPLIVVGEKLADGSAASVRAPNKVRVWIQANMHGNDADGKEAALMLIRDLANGKHWVWLPSVILLINPIFNADGSERLVPENKLNQNGPVNGHGRRTNAKDQDLALDHVMLSAPETNALVKLLGEYDPHVSIDLHTSEGVCFGYGMTYSPSLNPNVSGALMGLMKDDWLPLVTRNLETRHGIKSFYYGSVEGGDNGCSPRPPDKPALATVTAGRRGAGAPPAAGRGRAGGRGAVEPVVAPVLPAWTSFEHVPSFGPNYIGLRNRFAVVGVSPAFAPFEERVRATAAFLEENLTFVYGAATRLKKTTQDADALNMVGRRLFPSARRAIGPKIEVLMSEMEVMQNPDTGSTVRRRKAVPATVEMSDRLWYEPTSDELAAPEYFLPAEMTAAVDLLKKHGIQVRELTQPTRGVEVFTIETNEPGKNPRLSGTWSQSGSTVVPSGSWVVRMNQPLARLAFYLIEPASDDGLVKWNLLGDSLDGIKTYPITRRSK
jgi:hypothetical protein